MPTTTELRKNPDKWSGRVLFYTGTLHFIERDGAYDATAYLCSRDPESESDLPDAIIVGDQDTARTLLQQIYGVGGSHLYDARDAVIQGKFVVSDDGTLRIVDIRTITAYTKHTGLTFYFDPSDSR